jgi:DNA polymerase V
MFALVDATGAYASMEKVYDPSIRFRPVTVLTNNDGITCAICPIAKRLGVPKFEPYFKIKDFLHKHRVVVRSSNYELYAYISEQMMNVIARFCDNHYVYSIDESFLHFDHYQTIIDNWYQYGHTIRRAVWKETRMPVGVGFGSTLTLAKAANHAAKKLDGFDGVAVIDSEQNRQAILRRMALDDVWGIGSRLAKRLSLLGLKSAWDLSCQNPKQMRKQFSVTVERTVNELNNIPCLAWDEVKKIKKEIFSTRSFGQRITQINDLRSALTSHASIVVRKVRRQGSLIKRLSIFASSSPHDDSFFRRGLMYEFPVATSDISIVASAIHSALYELYQPGVPYYRCGVGAIQMEADEHFQADLFLNSLDNRKLMDCYDSINHRFGHGSLKVASEGIEKKWAMRRELLSPRYTTAWHHLPKIQC